MKKISLLIAILLLSTKTWAVDPLSIKSCKVLEKETKASLEKMLKIKDSIFDLASDPVKFASTELELQAMAAKSAVLAQQKEKLKCKFTLEVDANSVVKSVKETKEKIEAEEAEDRRWFVNALCKWSFCRKLYHDGCSDSFQFVRDSCSITGCSFKHYASDVYDGKYNTEYGRNVIEDFNNNKKTKICADTKSLSDGEIKTIYEDFNNQLYAERKKAISASYLKYWKAQLKTLLCVDEKEKCFKDKSDDTGSEIGSTSKKEEDCPCFKKIDSMDNDTALKEYGAYSKKVLAKRYPTGEILFEGKKIKIETLGDEDALLQYEALK